MDLGWIASVTGAREAQRGETVQSLWGGYGELCRVRLIGADARSVIVKWVRPPAGARGSSLSDARKRRSYEVEIAWYRTFASLCDASCRVPRFVASRAEGAEWLLVLEDLDEAGFTARWRRAPYADLERCIAWLAAFHARFMGIEPEGLWPTGTYWHLATRPDELAAIADRELRDAAPSLDEMLRSARFQTFVHGDAKEANFCFAKDGVAAVDFQYVGGGCGMKDVAYLLGGGTSSDEARDLDAYFVHLRRALASYGSVIDTDALEAEWRALYPIARADFGRFLAGWASSHWERDAEGRRRLRELLAELRESGRLG